MSNAAPTIILAEDDEGHANLVRRNLERAGVENGIVHVTDGQELLDYLHGKGAHEGRVVSDDFIVLLDINMPRIDGIEALRQIKANELTRAIPVIMLTTTDDPREIDRCYELGCNVYITKPVDYENFVEAIKRLGLFLQIVKRPRNGNGHGTTA